MLNTDDIVPMADPKRWFINHRDEIHYAIDNIIQATRGFIVLGVGGFSKAVLTVK